MRFKWVLIVLICGIQATGFAQGLTEQREDLSQWNPKDYWLYFGFDSGYADLSIPEERFLDGYSLGLKVVGSYYQPQWVYDLSLGFWNTRLSGGSSRVVNSHTGVFEMSPRYRVNLNWQIGPTVHFVFGRNSDFSTGSSNDAFSTLIGARALYEFEMDTHWAFRVGARLLTDLDLSDRQLVAGILDFQLGWGLATPKTSSVSSTSTFSKDELSSSQASTETAVVVRVPDMAFGLGETQLREKQEAFLGVLGNFLKNHPQQWEQVLISGHADQRGPEQYNLQLSTNRAEQVLSALLGGGAPQDRLVAAGYGSRQPLVAQENEVAWQKNRRVDLQFVGVKDPQWFNEQLARIEEIISE